MLGPIEVLKDVVAKMDQLQIKYFLVGSLASMYYGRPRFTNDIDLVVQIGVAQIKDFANTFDFPSYYCPPFEVIQDEVLRRGSFNLIHQDSGIKIDIVLNKNSEISKSEIGRRKKVEIIPGFEAFIASPEDVILKKLEFYKEGQSEKHLTDVREIVSSIDLDRSYLDSWTHKLDLKSEWLKAQE
ncbi:MAG: hypothetical protein COT73_02595 [Bdellovibrio sp. CG10_big_fil_rev_8_21_14_0_10_47_8]|nr:MAG: hypothetical protein COT73_02595 [Bdellovibrio sp. CG10_big_fil_rev_8_21_14_0_10_47_8]